jgi:hypothetical protein
MTLRIDTLAATDAAVDWEIVCKDEHAIARVVVLLDAAPETEGTMTIKVNSGQGAEFDWTALEIDMVGQTEVVSSPIYNLADGDTVSVVYANPDEVSILLAAYVDAGRPRGEDAEISDLGDRMDTAETGIDTLGDSLETHAGLISDLQEATAGISSNEGRLSAATAVYRRYYHAALGAVSPGASGATWTAGTANHLAGWMLDAAGEFLNAQSDLHSDWDGESAPILEFTFTVMSDNAAGGVDDTIDIEVVVSYAQPGQPLRTQTITHPVTVGQCAQYTMFRTEIPIDADAVDNVLLAGDLLGFRVSVPATGDLTACLVNALSVYYPTTHVGTFDTDI